MHVVLVGSVLGVNNAGWRREGQAGPARDCMTLCGRHSGVLMQPRAVLRRISLHAGHAKLKSAQTLDDEANPFSSSTPDRSEREV